MDRAANDVSTPPTRRRVDLGRIDQTVSPQGSILGLMRPKWASPTLFSQRLARPHKNRIAPVVGPAQTLISVAGDLSMSKPVLALIALLSTLLWYGLAVLGEGGFAAFFAHPARIALVIVGVVLAGVGILSEAGLRTGEREDRSNRWIFVPLLILSLLSGWLPAWCDRTDFLTLDGDAVRWIGVVLFAVGGALRLAPAFVLGRRFSGLVAIQPGHTLVTSGLYGTIRHPSYLGLLVMALGWGLAFRHNHLGALPTRGFLPWRFSNAGPVSARRQASAKGRHPKTFTNCDLRRGCVHSLVNESF
jgi:protein-S-isoprenylcysteine O-methyltransferase Ste14